MSGESVFRALAHPLRRRIILALRAGELPAGDILPPGLVSRPSISDHLRALRDSGLITFVRKGNRLIYRINPRALGPVADFLQRAR